MARLVLGRTFAEFAPDVRHAYVGPETGTDPVEINGTHWNAAHVVPDVEAGAFPGEYQEPAPGTTELLGAAPWLARLASIEAIRVQTTVVESDVEGTLELQYTEDLTGATGWTTLASVLCDTAGRKASTRDTVPTEAREAEEVLLRWVITV